MKEKELKKLSPELAKSILDVLLPWGYSSKEEGYYTGMSPYYEGYNIITVVINVESSHYPLEIWMETPYLDDNDEELNGYYLGVMRVIAPVLCASGDRFAGKANCMYFYLAADKDGINNSFGVDAITYKTKEYERKQH